MRCKLSMICGVLLLGSCGGDTGGGSVGGTPTPSPTPTPTPAPTPTSTSVATTIEYLHVFGLGPNLPGQPGAPLVQASDGNFYGSTRAGGTNICQPLNVTCGTIFRMTPAGTLTVLYNFGSQVHDGFGGSGQLVVGSDGALYGSTPYGGTNGNGTIFRITTSGTYQTLHSFGSGGGAGGISPGALMLASDGNFYGVTASGGANHCDAIPQAGPNCGTFFRMTPSGTVTVLHSFGGSEGAPELPNGPLVEGPDGNLYGTSLIGGTGTCGSPLATECGTVFRLRRSGEVTVLHNFSAANGGPIVPQGGLVLASDGHFYGTTPSGGLHNQGAVYRVTATGAFSTIYSFGATPGDGNGPTEHLIQARDGLLYGSTHSGGAFGGTSTGTVYRVSTSGSRGLLYSFGPVLENPTDPGGGVIQGTDGAFYGVTVYNGRLGATGPYGGFGTVFRLRVN